MMKLAIAVGMLMASLITTSAPAQACGYGKADTAKVYGWSKHRGHYKRGKVYGSRAYVGKHARGYRWASKAK